MSRRRRNKRRKHKETVKQIKKAVDEAKKHLEEACLTGSYIGNNADAEVAWGTTNTAIGYNALQSTTPTQENTAVGLDTLRVNTTAIGGYTYPSESISFLDEMSRAPSDMGWSSNETIAVSHAMTYTANTPIVSSENPHSVSLSDLEGPSYTQDNSYEGSIMQAINQYHDHNNNR